MKHSISFVVLALCACSSGGSEGPPPEAGVTETLGPIEVFDAEHPRHVTADEGHVCFVSDTSTGCSAHDPATIVRTDPLSDERIRVAGPRLFYMRSIDVTTPLGGGSVSSTDLALGDKRAEVQLMERVNDFALGPSRVFVASSKAIRAVDGGASMEGTVLVPENGLAIQFGRGRVFWLTAAGVKSAAPDGTDVKTHELGLAAQVLDFAVTDEVITAIDKSGRVAVDGADRPRVSVIDPSGRVREDSHIVSSKGRIFVSSTGPDGGTGVLSSCGLALEDCAIVASKPLRATNQHAGEVAATDTWVYWAADKLYRFKRTL